MSSKSGKDDIDDYVRNFQKVAVHRGCREGKNRHSTFGELKKCAKSECEICLVMLQGVQEWAKSKDIADNAVIMRSGSKCDGTMPRLLSIYWSDAMVDIDNPYVDLIMYTLPRQFDSRSAFGTARTVPLNSSSDSTFSLAISWLDDCVRSHTACRQSGGGERPARIIDIGSKADNSRIRLSRSPTGTAFSYLALSHCWGAIGQFKTEISTLSTHEVGINWKDLPQTFQDAIKITRRLGARYLWIDSLCIIQDSSEDWERESSKMSDIYENSLLTISAAFGADSTAGCFHDRFYWTSPLGRAPITADLVSFKPLKANGADQTIFVRRHHEHETINSRDTGSPLFQRAWAFQERLLSARTLHYTKSEVSWECRTKRDCECGCIKFDNAPKFTVHCNNDFEKVTAERLQKSRSTLKATKRSKSKFMNQGKVSIERLEALEAWRNLASTYNQRYITYPQDKLPAISGIAKRIRKREYGSYCSGLWEADLPISLLWRHTTGEWRAKQDLVYVAPSWSWASVDGSLHFPSWSSTSTDGKQWIHAEVKEVHCTASGLDPFGRISQGYIVLQGPVTCFRWEVSSIGSRNAVNNMFLDGAPKGLGRVELEYDPILSPAAASKDPEVDVVLFTSEYDGVYLKSWKAGLFPEKLWLMWVYENIDSTVYMIILKKSEKGSELFERVGILYVDYDVLYEEQKEWWKKFNNIETLRII